MALDYSKFGTRISLSERFAIIRKEAQKRSILVNPSIDTPKPALPNKNVKNFNGTFSRADRPSAALQQGSDRNKRLVLQMAIAPSVLAEINQSYNPQIRAQIPNISQNPQLRKQPRNVRQRLGAIQNRNIPTRSVKSRLGIKRTPVSQRIGIKPTPQSAFPANNRVMNNAKLRARNTVAFKKKMQIPNKTSNFTQAKPIKIIRGRALPNRKPIPNRKPVTAEQLDQDLDVYMQNTKSSLNADLDAYMSHA